MKLILSSRSPRRQELLRKAGIEFEVRASSVEEVLRPQEKPEETVRRLAREKALDVAASSAAGRLVLGADTEVILNGRIFGKPNGPADAERMLRSLSGRTHQVVTAICLVRAPAEILAWKHEVTSVTFRALDEDEIRNYIASGEVFDKAGGYAIQGLASKFVTRVEGCFFNVVGLPVPAVYEILKPFLKA